MYIYYIIYSYPDLPFLSPTWKSNRVLSEVNDTSKSSERSKSRPVGLQDQVL